METTISANNKSGNRYIAFFDLDHTILSINSGKALIQMAYRKGLLSKPELLNAFWFSVAYRLKLGDTINLLVKMVGWIKGKNEKSLDDLAGIVFNEQVLNSLREEIITEISHHKDNGAITAILSSSIMPLCSRVAGHLGIDDIICSDLEIKDGVYTGKATGNICFGKEKAVRLTEYCLKNNFNPSESYYYGDSIDDFHALSIVGYPVCVYPDKRLRKIAESRGWKIICRAPEY
jgi:HAD superfamily hydrolase (TIGR01490 family)